MVLEETSERRVLHIKKGADTICYYTDIKLGLYIVRGDSMVLLGEVETATENPEEEKEKDTEEDGDMMGSGLLGGPEKAVAEDKKKLMKEVSLEEFEKLEEENKGDAVQELTWEFDLDLVV